MKKIRTLLFLIMIPGFLTLSCSKDGGSPEAPPAPKEETSQGEIEVPLRVVFVQLKVPSLLSSVTATKDKNGEYQYTIDQKLNESLLAEQQNVIKKLAEISPEIKILYTYKMVLNALAVQTPWHLVAEIEKLNVKTVENEEEILRNSLLKASSSSSSSSAAMVLKNSVDLVGAYRVHDSFKTLDANGNPIAVKGYGIKVGVIDSGIDYTHEMFGGPGDPSVFTDMDPTEKNSFFPNSGVKGGRDFAGDDFENMFWVPVPDENPLDDISGHGTFIAGILSGKGNGVSTYDGVAPQADLYALKVFSLSRNTNVTTIAAMEYAADPNQDLLLDDRLDVLNLSLESPFGRPNDLFEKAIYNLNKGGVVVVAAAGNNGYVTSIVGTPGTAEAAISVGASTSSSYGVQIEEEKDIENYIPAVKFQTPNHPIILTKLEQMANVAGGPATGKLFSMETTGENQWKNRMVLIDQSEALFDEKMQKACEAGVTGVVVIDSEKEQSIAMAPSCLTTAVVVVPFGLGQTIKEEMDQGDVIVDFNPSEMIEKPIITDTIAKFSSKGPREFDGIIKPEITAPGKNIFSAEVGTGNEVKLEETGGTSLSSPHVAGVAALLLQYRGKKFSPQQIKSMIVNSGSLIRDPEGSLYPISRQGAGRLNAYRALTAELVFSKPTISFGNRSVSGITTLKETFKVENIAEYPVHYHLSSIVESEGIELSFSQDEIHLEPGQVVEIEMKARLRGVKQEGVIEDSVLEANAFVAFSKWNQIRAFIPVLAIISKSTNIQLEQLVVDASDMPSSAGKDVKVVLSNFSANSGPAFLFNHLDWDKNLSSSSAANSDSTRSCDLESSGYRMIKRGNKRVLQVAVKLFNPVNTWAACNVRVGIDLDGDDKEDAFVFGGYAKRVVGDRIAELGWDPMSFKSFLYEYLDTTVMNFSNFSAVNYVSLGSKDMYAPNHSAFSIVEFSLDRLSPPSGSKEIWLNLSVNSHKVVDVSSDLLLGSKGIWKRVSLNPSGSGYTDFPEQIEVPRRSEITVNLKKGENESDLLVGYFPRNSFSTKVGSQDSQSTIKNPTFKR